MAGQQHLRTAEVQIKNTTQPRLWLEVTLLGLLPSANIQPTATGVSPRVTTPHVVSTSSNHRQSSPQQFLKVDPPSLPQQPNSSKTASTNGNGFSRSTQSIPEDNHTDFSNSVSPPAESVAVPHLSTSVSPQPAENGSTPRLPAQEEPVITPAQQVSPVSPKEEVVEATQYDLTQIWQQMLANLQPKSRQEMLRQMGHLIEFDGTAARVAVKPVWYDKVKSDLPMIAAAFQQTFRP